MKLLLEEMNKRWVLFNEFELNKEFVKCAWIFYSLYDISLAVCKIEDKNISLKNRLIFKLVLNPLDYNTYNKIKKFMVNDVDVINQSMNILENVKGGGTQMGDYKKPTMFAINVNE